MKYKFLALILIILSLSSCGWKRDSDAAVRMSFHSESKGAESRSLTFEEKLPGLRGTHFFRTVPEFTHRQITGFYPFKSETEDEWGAIFELNRQGAQRLLNTTSQNVGSHLIIKYNGTTIGTPYISKPISDGIIVTWKGIKTKDLKLFEKKMTRLRSQPAGISTRGTGVNIDASGYGGWDPMRR